MLILNFQTEDETDDISSKSISIETKPEAGPVTASDRRTGSTNDRYTPIFEPKVQQMYDEDSIISEGKMTIPIIYTRLPIQSSYRSYQL